MWEKKRYHELLFMIDTCQANTMFKHFYSPNIVATGSSEVDESSYSHHADGDVGVAVIDRWTYYILEFLETQVTTPNSKLTLGDLFDSYDKSKIHSNPGVRWDLFPGGEQAGRLRTVMDFFGNVQNVDVDKTSDTQGLQDDLVAISKLVEDWKRMEKQLVNATTTESAAENNPDGHTSPRQEPPKEALRVKSAGGWKNQATGISVLAGLGAIWFAESVFGKR
ncbi:hypothetical protein KEM56_001750 [Ascosphaera pollenicola]|nr:hypothetical protein KEM56_001750 [Ascosphaera pollenicola]